MHACAALSMLMLKSSGGILLCVDRAPVLIIALMCLYNSFVVSFQVFCLTIPEQQCHCGSVVAGKVDLI